MDLKAKLLKTGIVENTVTNHITNLKRIANNGKLNQQRKYDTEADPTILKNDKKVLAYIYSDSVTLNVKKTLLNSVIQIIKVMYPRSTKLLKTYEKEFVKIADMSTKSRTFAKANEKEENNKISMDDLIQLRNQYEDELTDKYTANDYKYVLLSLYTMLPPLRSNEWIQTKMFDNEPPESYTGNYINMHTGQMHVRISKTKNKYGERVFQLPNELLEVLKQNRIKSKSDLVLPKMYNPQLKTTESNISHVFNNIVGLRVSAQMLRKIYISKLIDEGASKKKRKEVAHIMGHSLKTQLEIYSKFSTLLHDD